MKASIVFAVCLALSSTASAQAVRTGTDPRGFVTVNGAYQVTSTDFAEHAPFTANAETGERDTAYKVKSGPALDVGGGVRLGRHVGVGATFSRFSVATAGTLTASVPHPFFFNRNRQVDATLTGLHRQETGIHMQLLATLPVGRRFEVSGFGGPSVFLVDQDVVTAFQYSDEYPYDTATFRDATTTGAKQTKVGFNVGGDIAFFFNRQFGVGFMAQESRATASLPAGDGRTIDATIGGLHAGGGVRVRF